MENYSKYKEKTELLEKEIKKEHNFTTWDLIDTAELSYLFGTRRHLLDKLDYIILQCSADGINTYGLFVIECLEYYKISEATSFDEFIQYDLQQVITNFIEKYFEEVK